MDAHPSVQDVKWDLVMHYLAPIAAYFEDSGVTDIYVNRYDQVYVERHGQFERAGARWDCEAALVTTIEQIANALAQPVHRESQPMLDARLPDGSRINAVLSPTAVTGSNMTIRLFPKAGFSAEALVRAGSFAPLMLDFIELATRCRYNVLIAGGTGSGKTTLLNAIANLGPYEDRVITIEDTAELKIMKSQVVSLEAPRRQGSE